MTKEKKDAVEMADTQAAGAAAGRYSKGQILASAKFAKRRDILAVLLEDGKEYTIAQVSAIMDGWFRKGVK